MSTPDALSIIQTLAASTPMDFPNRVKAVEAAQQIESELSVLSAIRTAQSAKPTVTVPQPHSQPS